MADRDGNKTGGRQKGTPNKATEELQEIARKFKYHPFEIMMMYAHRDHKALGLPEYTTIAVTESGERIEKLTISPELQEKSAKDANEYLAPKRKAVEHTGKNGEKLFSIEDYLRSKNQET
jgi:hypothetical protein